MKELRGGREKKKEEEERREKEEERKKKEEDENRNSQSTDISLYNIMLLNKTLRWCLQKNKNKNVIYTKMIELLSICAKITMLLWVEKLRNLVCAVCPGHASYSALPYNYIKWLN